MNKKEIESFERIQLQLKGMFDEVKSLSSKQPDGAINLFKLRLINQILKASNEILKEKNRPFKDFLIFNEEDIPSNSDVVLIFSGYLSAFEKIRQENIDHDGEEWYWNINGEISEIRTAPPRKLGKQ